MLIALKIQAKTKQKMKNITVVISFHELNMDRICYCLEEFRGSTSNLHEEVTYAI